MSIEVVIIGDTHITTLEKLPLEMLRAIKKADWVVHVGDYTSKSLLDRLIELKGQHFKGVYGNSDPQSVRDCVPDKDIFEINGKRIGITHPKDGGSHSSTVRRILAEFRNDRVNTILYGHTHDPKIENRNNILLVNPGKGYLEENYYGPPTTIAVLRIDDEIQAKIIKIQK